MRPYRRDQILAFWSPRGEGIGPHVLSQWYRSPFMLDGTEFDTAEHWMMYSKARLFGDDRIAEEILSLPHQNRPNTVQKLGRQVRGFDQRVWDAHKYSIVLRGNLAKFHSWPALGDWLSDRGETEIVEASPYDCVWGVGVSESDPRLLKPWEWPGENLLGQVLDEVRMVLQTSSLFC